MYSFFLIMAPTTRSILYLHDLIFFCFLHIILFCVCLPCYSVSDGCLEEGSRIIDGQSTLISPGEVFELGFFSPEQKSPKNRYLGIWYYDLSNPKVIVWVANRDKPLLGTDGFLVVDDGNAMVSDTNGTTYWLAGSGLSARLCLEDSGNLTLHGRGLDDQILWQSFNNPTDTFLPGMNAAGGSLNLTSWLAPNNPAKGHYVFFFQQLNSVNTLIIKGESLVHYWDSSITPFDQPPQPLLFLLLNDSSQLKDYNNTRLVMNVAGQIQFWGRDITKGVWSLLWSEPKDKCDLFEACGVLGSCNSKNGLLCKCLPGTFVGAPKNWNSGSFSEGCLLKSQPCHRRYSEDVFLRMPMMKVKAPKTNETNIEDCETECRSDETCLAYSCGVTDCKTIDKSNEKRCLIWSNNELTDLQEEYPTGLTIFFRTTSSDIELTPKDCKPCGTYIIPYPLSTAVNCGDSSYLNFKCNTTTGQVYFSTSNLTYKITSLDPVAKKFTVQLGHGNSCGSKYIDALSLLPKYSLHYNFGNCNVVKDPSSLELEQSFVEVEIGWKPPPEPTCNRSLDCHDWPHTTCKAVRDGKMRCMCGSMYHWNGDLLKCKVTFFKVVVLGIAGALVVLCGIFFSYYIWKIRRIQIQHSIEFEGDNTESVDVPFFNWEIILAATNNFADVNKLGTGGFGCVYKGTLPDGQEMAIKRLSTASMQGLEEFKTEVKLIAKLQHRNLVRLIGYCVKGFERILVYEYMPNGSLDSCLFDDKHPVYLNWKERFHVILALARGLLYLHQDSRLRIIHRDLKPSNILLDEELNPKISDFGIARTVEEKETEAKTAIVVGTYGYMSPEYAYDGIFSIKSDVFSFGVVVLETICGRRNSKMFMLEHGLSLLGHAWKLWNEDKALELLDPNLNESCLPTEVQKCIHIGLLCVQEDPSDRPTMSTVVYMLSFETAPLPPAKQPAFMNRKKSEPASSSSVKDLSMLQEVRTVPVIGR